MDFTASSVEERPATSILPKRLIVVDTETTGVGRSSRVVEFACLLVDDDQVVERWETLIKSDRGPGPTKIHGITMEMIEVAPTFLDVAATIEHLFAGRVPVGHNLAFDWSVLHGEFRRVGVVMPPSHGGLCTASLGEGVLGRRGGLGELCRVLGVEHLHAHRAATDAEATLLVLRRLGELGCRFPSGRPCPGFGRAWTLPGPASPLPRHGGSQHAKDVAPR